MLTIYCNLSDITRGVIGQLSGLYSITGSAQFQSVFPRSIRVQRDYTKYLTNPVFFVRTVSKITSFSALRFMARAFRLGHEFERKKLGLQLRIRTGLVRSMYPSLIVCLTLVIFLLILTSATTNGNCGSASALSIGDLEPEKLKICTPAVFRYQFGDLLLTKPSCKRSGEHTLLSLPRCTATTRSFLRRESIAPYSSIAILLPKSTETRVLST